MHDHSFVNGKARLTLLLRRRIGSMREDKDFDRIIRNKTYQIIVFSMSGVVMMLLGGMSSWMAYSSNYNVDAYYDDPRVPARVLDILYVVQAFISASTFVTIVLISQKYQLELIAKRAEWSGTNIFEVEGFRGVSVQDTNQRDYFVASFNFWRSRLAVSFVMEVFVHLLHPIVWMASVANVPADAATYTYTAINLTYKLFQLAMFLRFYLFYDLIHKQHPAYIHRFEVVNNDPDLLSVGFDIDPSLTLKMAVHEYPTGSFVLVSLVALVVFGYAVFTLERVEGATSASASSYIKPENAFWFAFVTSRTIGYGEYSPRTLLGRFAAAACTMVGISTASIFSGVLVAQIPLSRELKKAVEFLATDDVHKELQNSAVSLIQTAFRRHLDRRDHNAGTTKTGAEGQVKKKKTIKEGDIIRDNDAEAARQATMNSLTRYGIDLKCQGHKADRLYHATKAFRESRKKLMASFTQANDVVVSQKMDCLMALAQALKKEMTAHQEDVRNTEREVLLEFNTVAKHVLYYKKLGHDPV